jgi:hypothetical protein
VKKLTRPSAPSDYAGIVAERSAMAAVRFASAVALSGVSSWRLSPVRRAGGAFFSRPCATAIGNDAPQSYFRELGCSVRRRCAARRGGESDKGFKAG